MTKVAVPIIRRQVTKCRLAPGLVAEVAEDHAADGPRDETRPEGAERQQRALGGGDVKQLTGLDATFLHLENPTQFGHEYPLEFAVSGSNPLGGLAVRGRSSR